MTNQLWSVLASDGTEFLVFLALAAVKTTFLLAFVALLCKIFRGFSAATRHLLWTFMFCASLLLPFLSLFKGWEVPILPATAAVSTAGNNEVLKMSDAQAPQDSTILSESAESARKKVEFQVNRELSDVSPISSKAAEFYAQPQKDASLLSARLVGWSLLVWLGVGALLLCRLLLGFISTGSLARRAASFKEPEINELFSVLLGEFKLKETTRLLGSERIAMPVVCGIFRSTVLLPAAARQWSEERLQMVLLHELAHVARRDCLTQILAQIACAFYWFNPFVWSAARRLRIERERACDDHVLSIGTKPSDYAHHLLEIARSMQERSIFEWSQTASVAMARRSQLEGRLVAILSGENKHKVVSRATTAGIGAVICLLFISLAIVRPTVVNAQKAESHSAASGGEKDKTEPSLLDSLLSIGSEKGNAANNPETQKANEKQENESAGDAAPFINGLIDKDLEPQTAETVRQGVEQSDAAVATPTPPAETFLSPESEPETPSQPDDEDETQLNVKYQRENKSDLQNQSQDFLEEMASVGYTNLSIDELIELRAVGVNASYVRSLRAAGLNNLKVSQLVSLRAVGVTPAYIEGIRSAGYKDLTAGQLTEMRALDVTPEFINKLRNAGYGNLSVGNLSEFSAHGITTDYINSMNNLGFGKLPPRDLVELRVFGVTSQFVALARSRLGNDLTLRQIIGLKNTGILKDKNKNKDKK
jgi:beta-lactamase regulating signal transducer with metallopeptidase domain